jgi:curved DNA-binding protein CbpA
VPGDCGSWVINPIDGSLYGIIIATAPDARESYLIPACKMFDSIKSRLPASANIEFPTPTYSTALRDRRKSPKLQRLMGKLDLRAEWQARESLMPKRIDYSHLTPPPLPSRPPQPTRQDHSQGLPQGTSLLPEDPYTVLGVEKDADLITIRSNHRKLVLQHHPDRIKDEADRAKGIDEFMKVQQAYALLSDPALRARYDEHASVVITRDPPIRSALYPLRPIPRNEEEKYHRRLASQLQRPNLDRDHDRGAMPPPPVPQQEQVFPVRRPSIGKAAASTSAPTLHRRSQSDVDGSDKFSRLDAIRERRAEAFLLPTSYYGPSLTPISNQDPLLPTTPPHGLSVVTNDPPPNTRPVSNWLSSFESHHRRRARDGSDSGYGSRSNTNESRSSGRELNRTPEPESGFSFGESAIRPYQNPLSDSARRQLPPRMFTESVQPRSPRGKMNYKHNPGDCWVCDKYGKHIDPPKNILVSTSRPAEFTLSGSEVNRRPGESFDSLVKSAAVHKPEDADVDPGFEDGPPEIDLESLMS